MAVATSSAVRAAPPPKPVAMRVELEDHGQDFLEWDLDEAGVVLDCRPFQAALWVGVRVRNHARLRAGSPLLLTLVNGDEITLNYPAAMVMRMPRAHAGRVV